MAEWGSAPGAVETREQQRSLRIALLLNAAMFVVEVAAGWLASSTGLIADGLDMLTDASAYGIALVAIGRSFRFKARAATVSGALLLVVGFGLLAEIGRRALEGSEPAGSWMMAVAFLALAVNIVVLHLLARHRSGEVHLRAAWIFTRADVVANAAVIVSGAAVLASGIGAFDLVVGAAIGLYVVKEALEILGEAKTARRTA